MGVLDWRGDYFSGVLGDEGRCRGGRREASGGCGVFCGGREGVGCDILVGFDGRGVECVQENEEGGYGAFCVGGSGGNDRDWRNWMRYRIACDTQMGVEREVNQDALLVKCGRFEGERLVLAVICDGMGGLQKGEVASALLVKAFSVWFERELPFLMVGRGVKERMFGSWDQLIRKAHKRMRRYEREKGVFMGTTLTAMMFVRQTYYVVQVGDSRAYEIREEVRQLTKDQSLVQREVDEGRLSKEQARRDHRRNVLLQCVGASEQMEPVYGTGVVQKGAAYLLCSDGFWHGMEEETLGERGRWQASEAGIRSWLQGLVKKSRKKGEQDDISVIAICT